VRANGADSIGAGLLDQTQLYNDNHSHSAIEAAWFTAPSAYASQPQKVADFVIEAAGSLGASAVAAAK